MSENTANDCNGAKLRESTRVEYIGPGPMRGRRGHVTRVYDWQPNGPQTIECIDNEGHYFVALGFNLRRLKGTT